MRAIAAGVVAAVAGVALLAALTGCGGDEGKGGQVQEEALRDCLSEAGLTVEASDLGNSAALGTGSPDFQVTSAQGEIADVLVEGSDQKANRRAADIEGAKQSFGAGQTQVVLKHNAVVVFEGAPPADFRRQIETCLD